MPYRIEVTHRRRDTGTRYVCRMLLDTNSAELKAVVSPAPGDRAVFQSKKATEKLAAHYSQRFPAFRFHVVPDCQSIYDPMSNVHSHRLVVLGA